MRLCLWNCSHQPALCPCPDDIGVNVFQSGMLLTRETCHTHCLCPPHVSSLCGEKQATVGLCCGTNSGIRKTFRRFGRTACNECVVYHFKTNSQKKKRTVWTVVPWLFQEIFFLFVPFAWFPFSGEGNLLKH